MPPDGGSPSSFFIYEAKHTASAANNMTRMLFAMGKEI